MVLKWSLKLEQDGILREGLTFKSQGKATASEVSYNINNFYGPVGQSQIQQSSEKPIQIVISSDINLKRVEEFLNKLKGSTDELDPSNESELKPDIQTIQSLISSPRPKHKIFNESLNSMGRILEGAIGGVGEELLAHLVGLMTTTLSKTQT